MEKQSSIVAFFAFLFIIGVFNIWYLLEMMQVLPRVPFKILSSGIFFIIFSLFFIKKLKNNLNFVTIIVGIFIIYLILYNIIHYYNYIILDKQTSKNILYENLGYLYSYIIYFFVGFYYRGFLNYRKMIYFFYMIMTVNVLMFINISTLGLDITRANLDLFGIYLFLGDTYAIFSIATIILTRSKILQLLLFLISISTLYILMSRTSLYVFVLTMAIYIFVTNKKIFFTYLTLLVGVVFVAFVINPSLMEELINSRMLGFLFGDSDISVDARGEFLLTGWNAIVNHWFVGDFGGEAIYYNSTGTYIHNYLGLLRQYGIAAFMLFILLIILLFKEIYLWIKFSKKYTLDYEVFIGIMIFTLIESIIARAIYFPYIFFSIGVVCSLYKNRTWVYKLTYH